ncbi:MAG: DUF4870 domain-containing protein [Planctomycetota bacterium]|jgi:uncharacterized Tic20 family protein
MTEPQTVAPTPQAGKNAMAMLCHLLSFCGFFFPFGNILGPLVIWLVKREDDPLVDDQGKEVVNFQISVTIYGIVCAILTLVLIGILLLIALAVFDIVFTIIAAIKAYDGESFRYPLCIRFIK